LAQEFISKYCIPQGKVSRAYLKVPSFALGMVQHAEMIGGIDPGQMVEDIMIWGLGNAFHGPRLPGIVRKCRCGFLTLQRRSSLCIPRNETAQPCYQFPQSCIYQQKKQTDPGNIKIAYRFRNEGTGSETGQFLFWEYLFQISVQCLCCVGHIYCIMF
jgi:hypothetical protein